MPLMKLRANLKASAPIRALSVILLLTVHAPALLQAQRISYSFTKLATLGDRAPNGDKGLKIFHINDFEVGGLNYFGAAIYATDLGTAPDPATFFGEGAFLKFPGQERELELARAGASAPGGGVFGPSIWSSAAINDLGDAAFSFSLQPLGVPTGVNSGVFRYAHSKGRLTPVILPGITPVPVGLLGTFQGTVFETSLNNRGDLVFSGIIATEKGVHVESEPYGGLGVGVFEADAHGQIITVAAPGDPAPGGGVFDYAGNSGAGGATINNAGDIAFIAHVAGEESKFEGFPPQAELISALGSLYFRDALNGNIFSVAHAGDHATGGYLGLCKPDGGDVFREIISPAVNDFRDIAFVGDISPAPHVNQCLAVYLYSGSKHLAIALPGDSMPGGGKFVTSGFGTSINNRGEVVFAARLNTPVKGDGVPDSGLYMWTHGSTRLVARTGTVIPGIGTIGQVATGVDIIPPPPPSSYFPAGGPINDRGQILFGATLSDGKTGVLLLATPHDGNN